LHATVSNVCGGQLDWSFFSATADHSHRLPRNGVAWFVRPLQNLGNGTNVARMNKTQEILINHTQTLQAAMLQREDEKQLPLLYSLIRELLSAIPVMLFQLVDGS
jgi:hypothetical protein